MTNTAFPYINFEQKADAEAVVHSVKEAIRPDGEGYCIVRNGAMDADEFMMLLHERVAASFTNSSVDGRRVPYDLVMDRGEEQYNKGGSILSASNLVFPLHTDCSYLDKPADVVTLYCVQNSESGGESLLLNINKIIPLLPQDHLQLLLTQKFRIYSKEYSILERSGPLYLVRYSIDEMLSSYPEPAHESLRSTLAPFNSLLNNSSHYITIKLKPNDCLLVNNRTSLHGRHAFEANSRRVFLRARQYWRDDNR
ncbi:MAG TPA: TauD/TfdA family dioxygenase [Flavisolibacter sp.]|jgi:alpha-ketoglutarate-dependent taurine dioxygenase